VLEFALKGRGAIPCYLPPARQHSKTRAEYLVAFCQALGQPQDLQRIKLTSCQWGAHRTWILQPSPSSFTAKTLSLEGVSSYRHVIIQDQGGVPAPVRNPGVLTSISR
jgi:hypothetical protein